MPAEPWPPELDALTAAPENHKLLFENESVRILETIIQPGQTTPLHTHCWPAALYVLSVGDFIRRDENGTVTLDSRNSPPPKPGAALWIPPIPPHTLENLGTTEIRIIAAKSKLRIREPRPSFARAGTRAFYRFGTTSASIGNPDAITYAVPSAQLIHFFPE